MLQQKRFVGFLCFFKAFYAFEVNTFQSNWAFQNKWAFNLSGLAGACAAQTSLWLSACRCGASPLRCSRCCCRGSIRPSTECCCCCCVLRCAAATLLSVYPVCSLYLVLLPSDCRGTDPSSQGSAMCSREVTRLGARLNWGEEPVHFNSFNNKPLIKDKRAHSQEDFFWRCFELQMNIEQSFF